MAFATSNVRSGATGDLRFYCGDWSGSVGDASGTVTLDGGRVFHYSFTNQDADSPNEFPQVDVSSSGRTLTLKVHNHMNVTNGRFYIVFA